MCNCQYYWLPHEVSATLWHSNRNNSKSSRNTESPEPKIPLGRKWRALQSESCETLHECTSSADRPGFLYASYTACQFAYRYHWDRSDFSQPPRGLSCTSEYRNRPGLRR